MGAQTGGAAGDELLSLGLEERPVSVCVCVHALCQQQALSLERASTWRATSAAPPSQKDVDSRTHRPGPPFLSPTSRTKPPAHCPWH